MGRGGAYPVPRFAQALLEDWTLTDASGVVDTITDNADGSCSILTTATSGTFYLTKAITTDWRGSRLDIANRFTNLAGFVRYISGSNDNDRFSVGWSNNADPTAGLWQVGGLRRSTSTTWAAHVSDDAAESTGTAVTISDPIGVHIDHNRLGRSAQLTESQVFDGTTWKTRRFNNMAARVITPTHLTVRVQRNTAAIITHKVEFGFCLYGGPSDVSVVSGV